MKTISGSYRRDGKNVPFNCNVPSTWTELTPQQYATIIQVLTYEKADPFVVSTSLLATLFDARNFHILNHLPPEDLYALVPLTNFILEEKPPLRNVFPTLKLGGKKLHAPADDLSNIGFGEWCFVYEFYRYYRISRNVSWARKLIATLYRHADRRKDPKRHDYDGDIRLPFNENLIDGRAKYVEGIREDVQNAILAWFELAIRHVADARPKLFPKQDPEADFKPAAPDQSGPDGRTWLDVFRELLGPKWGTVEQLKHTNAMFVLDELQDLKIEYDKARKK